VATTFSIFSLKSGQKKPLTEDVKGNQGIQTFLFLKLKSHSPRVMPAQGEA